MRLSELSEDKLMTHRTLLKATRDVRPATTNRRGPALLAAGAVAAFTLCALLATDAWAGTVSSQDLVVYIRFEDNFLDSSGKGNHASVGGSSVGSPTIISDGKFGKAVAINDAHRGSAADRGSLPPATTDNQYLTLGTPSDLDFGTSTDFTISMWYRVTRDQDGDPIIIGNKGFSPGNLQGWLIVGNAFNGDDPKLNAASGSNLTRADTGHLDLFYDQWEFVVATFDRDGDMTLYIDNDAGDGTLDTKSVSMTNVLNVDTTGLGVATNIGEDGTGIYVENLVADFDDLAIWRRVLTGDEIDTLFNAGAGVELASVLTPEIPEPSTVVLIGLGAVALVFFRLARRRRHVH